MKILVLSHISELVGGAEKSILDLFDLWAKKYDVEPEFILRMPVGTLGSAIKERGWKYNGVDYTFWSEANPPKNKEAIKNASIKNTKAVVEIEAIIKKTKPDLVLTNSVVCPWAALAAHYQGVPHVWFVREYGDLDHGRVFEIGRSKTWADVGNLSELVITNSKALAAHVKQYIDPAKVTTLYHPFILGEIKRRAAKKVDNPFKQPNSLKMILAAGSLTGSKGVIEAVEAVGRLNQEGHPSELCLVGRQDNKEYLKQIKKIIKEYEITDKVHFVGWQKNPLAYMALADVGIMASRCEAFGRVTFEYLAIGKPVLGTDSGGTPEMVVNGLTGYLYKWGDIGSLAAGLRHYAQDKTLLAKHSKNAQEKADTLLESQFNADNLFARVKQVAEKSVKNPLGQKINYQSHLTDYARIKKEASGYQLGKRLKQKLKTKAGSGYRFGRSRARKIIKGY